MRRKSKNCKKYCCKKKIYHWLVRIRLTLYFSLLLFYFLTYFVVLFAKHFCFCFRESLIISFIIGEIESKNADIAVSFSK